MKKINENVKDEMKKLGLLNEETIQFDDNFYVVIDNQGIGFYIKGKFIFYMTKKEFISLYKKIIS